MTVRLSVHDLRTVVHSASGAAAGDGKASNMLLGRIFHGLSADLLGPKRELQAMPILTEAPDDRDLWRSRLVDHVYRRLLGPRLARDRSRLAASSAQVLDLWQATIALSHWLADLVWVARHPAEGAALPFEEVARMLRPESELSHRFRELDWSDDVEVTGIADLVVCVPGSGRWCVVELKTGACAPAADLAQACLYHLILKGALGSAGSLALASFRPDLVERVFSEAQLEPLRAKLIALIGSEAGVARKRGDGYAAAPSASESTRETGEAETLRTRLVDAYREYGVALVLQAEPIVGPTFIRFPAELGAGAVLAQLSGRAVEVQLRLGLVAPPMLSLERGRVYIDVQRQDRQVVQFSALRDQLPRSGEQGSAKLAIGVDLDRKLRFADLSNPLNCHVLVAGTTGSGKSEWMRFAIASLIATNTPQTLRLVLIDPKRSAFNDLKESPFLYEGFGLVYPDETPVQGVLAHLIEDMEARYREFAEAGVDNLEAYNRKNPAQRLPRVVCFCDEYYDLVASRGTTRSEIELGIARLGSKARAAGIHLVLATQQPSRQVISGVLSTNMPCRVGLKTGSPIESRMLLDSAGAEKLLGHGDLLFKDVGAPARLQAPLLSEADRRALFTPAR